MSSHIDRNCSGHRYQKKSFSLSIYQGLPNGCTISLISSDLLNHLLHKLLLYLTLKSSSTLTHSCRNNQFIPHKLYRFFSKYYFKCLLSFFIQNAATHASYNIFSIILHSTVKIHVKCYSNKPDSKNWTKINMKMNN